MTTKKESQLMAAVVFAIVVAEAALLYNAFTGGSLTGILALRKTKPNESILAADDTPPDPAPQFTDFIPRLLDAYVETDGQGDAGASSSAGTNTGSNTVSTCPQGLTKIMVPGTELHYLITRSQCIKPTAIIVHWSGGWSSAEGIANVLNERKLACQFATDPSHQLQLLDFYTDQVEKGSCVWGENNYTINNEISGVYFDDVFQNPANEHYAELQASTEKALQTTCWTMKQYGIPATRIFGHFQINADKQDPGPAYLEYFKNLAAQRCV